MQSYILKAFWFFPSCLSSLEYATSSTRVRNLVPCSSTYPYLSELKVNCCACWPPVEHRGTGRCRDHFNIILTLCTWVPYFCFYVFRLYCACCMLCPPRPLFMCDNWWRVQIKLPLWAQMLSQHHIRLDQQFGFMSCILWGEDPL